MSRSVFARMSLAMLLMPACADGRGTPTQLQPGQLAACGSSTAISASRVDGALQFSWAPTCGAAGFAVANQSGAAVLWSVARPDGLATMAGPIVYGTAPAGTQPSGGAPPLQPGQAVRISLTGAASGAIPGGVVASAELAVP